MPWPLRLETLSLVLQAAPPLAQSTILDSPSTTRESSQLTRKASSSSPREDQGAHPLSLRGGTELGGQPLRCPEVVRADVLRVQDRLAPAEERQELRALIVLMALLVDDKVVVVDQLRELVAVVLQADREPARGRLGRLKSAPMVQLRSAPPPLRGRAPAAATGP